MFFAEQSWAHGGGGGGEKQKWSVEVKSASKTFACLWNETKRKREIQLESFESWGKMGFSSLLNEREPRRRAEMLSDSGKDSRNL